jgi:putative ABC transport system substrate-binding protein
VKRREFITLLGGAAAAWPLVRAGAQQAGKTWRIGYVTHVHNPAYDPLFERLRELGYVEGRNVIIERRYAQGEAEKFKEFAAEMIRLKADVIITSTTPAALAAKNATTTIPIVIPTAIDPVGTGLINSLAHPGGNITGGAILTGELTAKRLEVLKEMLLRLSRTAVLWNGTNPANALAWRETETEERPDALLVLDDALTNQYQKEIADFAIEKRIASVFSAKHHVEAGGLMSYGPNYPEMMHRAASQVDKILRGARPADIPMEQPTKFELVINLKTATAIGLTVPPTLLTRADEVIE